MTTFEDQIADWGQQLISGCDGVRVLVSIQQRCPKLSSQSSTISRVRRVVIDANLPVDTTAAVKTEVLPVDTTAAAKRNHRNQMTLANYGAGSKL